MLPSIDPEDLAGHSQKYMFCSSSGHSGEMLPKVFMIAPPRDHVFNGAESIVIPRRRRQPLQQRIDNQVNAWSDPRIVKMSDSSNISWSSLDTESFEVSSNLDSYWRSKTLLICLQTLVDGYPAYSNTEPSFQNFAISHMETPSYTPSYGLVPGTSHIPQQKNPLHRCLEQSPTSSSGYSNNNKHGGYFLPRNVLESEEGGYTSLENDSYQTQTASDLAPDASQASFAQQQSSYRVKSPQMRDFEPGNMGVGYGTNLTSNGCGTYSNSADDWSSPNALTYGVQYQQCSRTMPSHDGLPRSHTRQHQEQQWSRPQQIALESEASPTVSPKDLSHKPMFEPSLTAAASDDNLFDSNLCEWGSDTTIPESSYHMGQETAHSSPTPTRPSRDIVPASGRKYRALLPTLTAKEPTAPKPSKKRTHKPKGHGNNYHSQAIASCNSTRSSTPETAVRGKSRIMTANNIVPLKLEPVSEVITQERFPEQPQSAATMQAIHHRDARDNLLIKGKLAGMKYKEIKAQGGFDEAESTLRGRYRTLMKPKEARVRRPEWTDDHVGRIPPTNNGFVHANNFSDQVVEEGRQKVCYQERYWEGENPLEGGRRVYPGP